MRSVGWMCSFFIWDDWVCVFSFPSSSSSFIYSSSSSSSYSSLLVLLLLIFPTFLSSSSFFPKSLLCTVYRDVRGWGKRSVCGWGCVCVSEGSVALCVWNIDDSVNGGKDEISMLWECDELNNCGLFWWLLLVWVLFWLFCCVVIPSTETSAVCGHRHAQYPQLSTLSNSLSSSPVRVNKLFPFTFSAEEKLRGFNTRSLCSCCCMCLISCRFSSHSR